MIDRRLNYGRHHVKKFLCRSGNYKVVLDLGAGQGDDLLAAKKIQPEAVLYAVESYPEYVADLEGKNINVHALDIEREVLPFADESVDIVICNQILEHCKDIWWVFHEITRVLKKNGKIIIGVPNLASLHNRLLLALGKQPTAIQNNSAHLRGYTKTDMLKLVNSFLDGYSLEGFGGGNFYPFSPLLAKPLARFFPTGAWGIFFFLEKKKQYNNEFLEFPKTNKLETKFYLGSEI